MFWFISVSAILVAALAAAQCAPLLIAAASAGAVVLGMIFGRLSTAPKKEAAAISRRPRVLTLTLSAVVLAGALVASQLFVTTTVARADENGHVLRVVDGDTIDVDVNGVARRVRLLNIIRQRPSIPISPSSVSGGMQLPSPGRRHQPALASR
ncbi:thermonuclease family protein [Amnibacterium setariae]|nr:hypothetical protein [Amnibacterium setariae]